MNKRVRGVAPYGGTALGLSVSDPVVWVGWMLLGLVCDSRRSFFLVGRPNNPQSPQGRIRRVQRHSVTTRVPIQRLYSAVRVIKRRRLLALPLEVSRHEPTNRSAPPVLLPLPLELPTDPSSFAVSLRVFLSFPAVRLAD